MAITFRAASGAQGAGTTASSFSVTQPTGAAAGDIAVVAINVGVNTSFNTVTGWTLDDNLQNGAATSPFTSGVYYRVLDGTESWPVSFTCGAVGKFAWTCSAFTPGAGNTIRVDSEATPKQDTTAGTSHTANAVTAIASTVTSVILNMGRRQTSSATGISVTPPTGWTEPTNGDQTTATGAGTTLAQVGAEVCYKIGTSGAVTPGAATYTSAAANVFHVLITDVAPPPVSGPPLASALSQPAGARVSLLRTGLAMASLLPLVVAGPPPTSGPPVPPLHGPVAIRKVPPPRGKVHRRAGTFQGTGPPAAPLHSPVGPGGDTPSAGAQPARLPRAGRVYTSSHAGTFTPPAAGPATAYPLRGPVRAVITRPALPGTIRHLAGVYATQGPPVRPLRTPVRTPVPARTGGGTVTRRAGTLSAPGPKLTPLTRPVRAAAPRVLPRRGRVTLTPVTAVQAVVNVIAVYGAIPAAVRAALPPAPAGRHTASPVKASTVITSGPAVKPLHQPVRAPVPQRARGGTAASRAGTCAGTGPAVKPLRSPVRVQVPAPVLTGRAMAIGPIPAPVSTAPGSGPPIGQRGKPWQPAARPLPPRGRVYGAVRTVAVAPPVTSGPPLTPLRRPVRAPVPKRARGGVARSSPGAYAGTGPAVPPLAQPASIRVVYARTGHVQRSAVQAQPPPPPTSGPPVPPRAEPWRAALPPPRVHGFALAMAALPAPVSVTPASGPAIPPRNTPWHAPVPARARGGTARSGAGTRNGTGPALTPLRQPVRAAWPARTRAGQACSSRPPAGAGHQAATALSGTGTLAGSWILGPSAVLAGQGTLTGTPAGTLAGSAVLTGTGTLAGAAQVITPVPFTGLWTASPLPPRWQAALIPSRWHAAPLSPRWKVTAVQYEPIAAISVEYIPVLWTTELAGTEVDPTTLPVQFAVPLSSGNPLAPAQPVTWYAATWLTGPDVNVRGYVAQAIVGPTSSGGLVQLTAGQAFDLWGKITGSPESPVRFAGVLPVY